MTIYKELSFENDVKKIEGIQFSVMSADEIKRMSVAEIVSTDTYSGNEPIIGGLFDSRMGVIENDKICKVCLQKNTFCPGHFGHVELAKPIFHMQFFDVVRKILKCVCFRCSSLLVDPDDPDIQRFINKKISRQKKFDFIYKQCSKVKRCGTCNPDGCGAKQPNKITKENIGRIVMEWKNDEKTASAEATDQDVKKVIFFAEDVLNIFKRITDSTANILGFPTDLNRPEALLCTCFPVPPPAVRPSVFPNDTGQRCEDDLTHKLCDIIKTNNTLKQKIAKNPENKDIIDYWVSLVQYHVSTFVDNQLPGVPPAKQRTGRPLRSVTERLKSKEGRIRGNLMGKRVDFSARSVITPDPNISIDEVGVPVKIAMNLTFPETVNQFNKDTLLKYVVNGPNKYPGAKYIKKVGAEYRTVRINDNNSMDMKLVVGDIVERHLRDGDYVLFNRQPSLHKMSMMAHRVRVMEYDTFRLNVCCTPSYNADYDGDEMNMHVPQSLQTENELKQLASVSTQIISPKDSSPIISVVQDIALGIYKMTENDVQLNEKQVMNILANSSKFTGDLPTSLSTNVYDGKGILSSIFPPTMSTRVGEAVIKKGIITKDSGRLSKKTYQDMTNGIVHSTLNDHGKEVTRSLFDNTQRLICDWLVYNGFSVGVSDLMLNSSTKEVISNALDGIETDVAEFTNKIYAGELNNTLMMNNSEFIEMEMQKMMSSNNKKVEVAVYSDPNITSKDNRMLSMVNSRSKGNVINVLQMMGAVGQCSVEGKRISYGFDDRTLPHYQKYDDGPEARGFVKHSFIDGLNPQEFFFHAMGGREGLIDTAVKTSETGYLQRKLVKAMEDAKVHFDLSVRNANSQIVQFVYGDDGMDACKLEKQHLSYLKFGTTINDIKDQFFVETVQKFKGHVDEPTMKSMRTAKERPRLNKLLHDYFEQIIEDRHFVISKILKWKSDESIIYPIAFDRLIKNTVCIFALDEIALPSDLSIDYVFKEMEMLYKLKVGVSESHEVFRILVRHFLNPKKLIMEHNFTKEAFDYLCMAIKQIFYKSLVNPSELVGVVSAQSIGEPTTQLTLNTFHLSGVASASKAVRGVPRIKELLSISKNIKSPSLSIHLNDDYAYDMEKAGEAKSNIQTTYLTNFIESMEISYEGNNTNSDSAFIEAFDKYSVIETSIACDNDAPAAPAWVLRIVIDPTKMIEFTTDDIYRAFVSTYNERLKCVHSDDNSSKIIFRINLIPEKTEDIITDMKALEQEFLQLKINGVNGINNVSTQTGHVNMCINPKTKKLEQIVRNPDLLDEKSICVDIDDGEGQNDEDKSNSKYYTLETEGTNLRDVLGSKYVNSCKTISNDVHEIFQLLGIEAARQALFNEIDDIFKEAGNVNQRHIGLLVDTMTCRGSLLSIDRHGINRSDIGPLAKCSFEETSDILIKSGVFGDFDRMQGVAANVLVGQIPKCGTGDSDIIIDHSIISKCTPSPMTDKQTLNDACNKLDDLSLSIDDDECMGEIQDDEEDMFDVDVKVV